MGGAVAGAELQRDVQPARRHEPGSHAAGHARHRAARHGESAERRRRRGADAGPGEGSVPFINLHTRYPGARRLAAAPWRRGAARCRGLGLRARGRCARCRHHPALRGHRRPPRERRGRRRRHGQGLHQGAEGGGRRRGPLVGDRSMAGLRLPIESHPLQALVSEPLKPVFPTVVMSNAIHAYISQSDKGDLVIGAGIDQYNGYGQRGSFQTIEHTLQAIVEMFPLFSRVRMNRQWAGIVDVAPDACPIIGLTPVRGLYINCGWGTGGFKATPGSGWVMAHTVAQDRPHALNEPFSLQRFATGRLIDEHGAAAVAH